MIFDDQRIDFKGSLLLPVLLHHQDEVFHDINRLIELQIRLAKNLNGF